ncbi:MAG: sigma-70 family RNA polymerase sigma factor [Planctomycetota bacterium]|jgi:RNA polymerase sigma factor (sigma-70 family)
MKTIDREWRQNATNTHWLRRFPHYAEVTDLPRLDSSTDEELLRLRDKNFDAVYHRAMPIIIVMMHENFSHLWDAHYFEDMVSEAQIGLLKAIRSWDPEQSASLATWCYKLAQQHAMKELLKEQAYEAPLVSHDFFDNYDDEDESPENPNDTYGGPQGAGEAAMESEITYDLLRDRLSRENALLLDMMRDGYTQREIARAWNISQPQVSRKVAALEKIIRSLADQDA